MNKIFHNPNNTDDPISVCFNGETKTLKKWADELGIKHGTLHGRLFRLKWPIYEAFTASVEKKGPRRK
jgi:hypothetical protein